MATQSQSSEIDMISKHNMLMTYVLNNATSKMPMKASEMSELLGKNTKLLAQLLPTLTENLKKFHGIILQEVPGQKSGKKYICFAEDKVAPTEFDESQKSQANLLFIILSYIFMSGGSVYEAQLEGFLNGFKIFYDEDHSYFGPGVKSLITEKFVKQLYLKRVKSDSELDTEVKFLFTWGHRAHMEYNKMELLKSTAKLLGKDATFFQLQYQEACDDNADDSDEVAMEE